jgi:CheY-like chemotaxis protein
MHIAASADSALRFLQRHPTSPDAVFPALVLVDLKLSGASGLDLLRQLRADRRFACLPVVVFTTSDDPQDILASYASGANGYVVKPARFTDLVRLAEDLCRYWLNWNEGSPGC